MASIYSHLCRIIRPVSLVSLVRYMGVWSLEMFGLLDVIWMAAEVDEDYIAEVTKWRSVRPGILVFDFVVLG